MELPRDWTSEGAEREMASEGHHSQGQFRSEWAQCGSSGVGLLRGVWAWLVGWWVPVAPVEGPDGGRVLARQAASERASEREWRRLRERSRLERVCTTVIQSIQSNAPLYSRSSVSLTVWYGTVYR